MKCEKVGLGFTECSVLDIMQKKKLALILFVAFDVLILAFLAYAASRPDELRVQRDVSISAEAAKIYPYINDFHKWNAWSPWEKRDPSMKRTFSGAESGKGAVYEWDGNDEVGKGRMEIMDSIPSDKVVIKLDFIKPFEGHDTAEFSLVPDGANTKVSWLMYGPNNFLSKVMDCVFNMDKMLGTDFESGLSNLKTVTEAKATSAPASAD